MEMISDALQNRNNVLSANKSDRRIPLLAPFSVMRSPVARARARATIYNIYFHICLSIFTFNIFTFLHIDHIHTYVRLPMPGNISSMSRMPYDIVFFFDR